MKIATIKEAIKKFGQIDLSQEDIKGKRREELMALDHEILVEMIMAKEAISAAAGMRVGDLAKQILQDPEFITLSNGDVAEVCRELIPGSNTSHKSIASYVSKKRDDWQLPDRISIRRKR